LAKKSYRNRTFSGGINALDAEHAINDTEGVVALNVVVGNGYVETRNGLTLFNQDLTKTGGITSMTAAYFRDGTKQLIFSNDDDYYSLDTDAAVDTAWGTVGDMGTAVNNPFGVMYQDYVAFGTGSTANTPSKWDNTTFSAVGTPADASGDLRFMEYHQGSNIAYLLGAGNVRDNATHNNSILYYTTDVNDWSTGGTIGIGTNDGQSLTSVKSHSNILAYKDNSMYRLDIVYESNSGTNILRVLERFQDIGSVNHEVCQVALNDVLSLSQRHGVRGAGQVQTKLGGSGSRRLSTKIKPLLDKINWSVAKTRARGKVWQDKLYLAVPMNGSATNNAVFVGHLDGITDIGEIPWTLFSMNAGCFEIFQDENGVDQLLIGDSNSPKIYIFDPLALSDNQTNITTQFRTKKIDMGDLEIDEFGDIILAGQMTEITNIKVRVFVDGVEETFVITKDQILNGTGAIWSHVVGSEIVGGNSEDLQKPRWLAVLSLSDAQRAGSEIQIDVSSVGTGYFWRLDYMSINENLNYNLFADNHFVSAQA